MNTKSILILFFIFFISYQSFSQVNPNSPFENYDDTPLTKELAIKLTSELPNDSLKVLAIYDWIVENISVDSVLLGKVRNPMYWGSYEMPRNTNTLKSFHLCSKILAEKKTVNLGYTYLFSAMCNSIGIKNAIIKGYARNILVPIEVPNHAWIAFQLADRWYLADPTFDSIIYHENLKKGFTSLKHNFLMISPEVFLDTHFPLDPLWQMRTSTIALKRWNTLEPDTNIPVPYFNYLDSLKQYEKLDVEKKFISSMNRIMSIKEFAFIGHYEYFLSLMNPTTHEIEEYMNLNRQLNNGNKNIEEMARKILPRKKELFDRLSRIENHFRQLTYHSSKLSELNNPYGDPYLAKSFSSSLANLKGFMKNEKSSLEATIKELEPYQKKTTTKK